MKNKKIHYGIIGAGAIAQTWAQAFDGSRTSKLVAVADIRKESALVFSEKFECQDYSSYELMLKKSDPDAVIICTPPVTHPEISLHCLEKKVHVLCEKPFSLDSESARLMLRAAARSCVHLTMASKFRYVDDVVCAKRIVESGKLGKIILFENTFISNVDMSKRWNSDPKISGGGVLIDNGSHSVDIVRFISGPIRDIRVVEVKRPKRLPVEESVRIWINTQDNCKGKINLCWNSDEKIKTYIKIQCSQGIISVGWEESKYCKLSSPDWTVFGKGYNKLEAFRRQLDNFSNAISGKEKLLITREDAFASVKAIEAGYQSFRDNCWIALDQEYHLEKEAIPKAVEALRA